MVQHLPLSPAPTLLPRFLFHRRPYARSGSVEEDVVARVGPPAALAGQRRGRDRRMGVGDGRFVGVGIGRKRRE